MSFQSNNNRRRNEPSVYGRSDSPSNKHVTNESLPASWAVTSLADVLTPIDGGSTLHHGWSPQCEKQPSPSDEIWGVLKTTAIQDGDFLPAHNKRLPDKLAPKPSLEVRAGDMLITCAGPRSRCGVPCYVRQTRPRLMMSGKMYRFRVDERMLEPRFMEAYLRAPETQRLINAMKTGISDSGLNLTHDRFKLLPVPVAPRAMQERIADRIDELFTDLSAGVAALERVRKKLKRYRSAVLHAAVTGRLTAEWRKTHGPPAETGDKLLARILVDRRKQWEQRTLAKYQKAGRTPPKNWQAKYVEPAEPKTDDLPELQEGWCWASLDSLVWNCSYGTSVRCDYGVNGTPVLRIPNIAKGELDLEDIKYATTSLEIEDDAEFLAPGDLVTVYRPAPASYQVGHQGHFFSGPFGH